VAKPNLQGDLKALKRLIHQADGVLGTIPNPHPSFASTRESLKGALRLADSLAEVDPADALGAKGGNATAKRGPEYFAIIAAVRKDKGWWSTEEAVPGSRFMKANFRR
jgi:hypothetical protein